MWRQQDTKITYVASIILLLDSAGLHGYKERVGLEFPCCSLPKKSILVNIGLLSHLPLAIKSRQETGAHQRNYISSRDCFHDPLKINKH